MEDEIQTYHLMQLGDSSKTYDKVRKLSHLSSLMNNSALSLSRSTAPPQLTVEEDEIKQIIGTCLAISELSKREIFHLSHS